MSTESDILRWLSQPELVRAATRPHAHDPRLLYQLPAPDNHFVYVAVNDEGWHVRPGDTQVAWRQALRQPGARICIQYGYPYLWQPTSRNDPILLLPGGCYASPTTPRRPTRTREAPGAPARPARIARTTTTLPPRQLLF